MGDYNNPNENNEQQSNPNTDQPQNQQPQDQQPQNQQPQNQQPQNQQPQNQQPQNQQPQNQQPQNQQPQYQQPQYQQPQYQQPQYQQPQYQSPQYQQPQYQQQAPRKNNGMSIASLVCGIISLVICCCWYIALPLAIVSVILGIISIRGQKDGKGMAIAGIVLSGITIILAILIVVAVVGNQEYLEDFYNQFSTDFNADMY